MAFYLELERKTADGSYVNLTRNCWRLMKQGRHRSRIFMAYSLPEYCALRNVQKAGLFRPESSEHFAEYTPWFIKPGREI